MPAILLSRLCAVLSRTPAGRRKNCAPAAAQFADMQIGSALLVPYRIAIRKLDTPLCRDLALALPGQAHISAATRQFLRYLDRRDAPAVPARSTGFDNRP